LARGDLDFVNYDRASILQHPGNFCVAWSIMQYAQVDQSQGVVYPALRYGSVALKLLDWSGYYRGVSCNFWKCGGIGTTVAVIAR